LFPSQKVLSDAGQVSRNLMLSPEFKKLESIAEICQTPIHKKNGRSYYEQVSYHARNLARNIILFVGSSAAVRK